MVLRVFGGHGSVDGVRCGVLPSMLSIPRIILLHNAGVMTQRSCYTRRSVMNENIRVKSGQLASFSNHGAK